MIDCRKCPLLIKYLGLYDARYHTRHWEFICGGKVKDRLKGKKIRNLSIRKFERNYCKYRHDENQQELKELYAML
jgi:hypothetical protein